MLMLVMDIIPNYNYYHLFYFRGVYNPREVFVYNPREVFVYNPIEVFVFNPSNPRG